ncbi:MAG TPA: peptidase [Actinomycetota bacterium]|nr:peptidase [Actinomycetota bacterium]
MTFCIGIKVHDGLVGIADTRISMGSQTLTARKITVIEDGDHSMLLMTSGLRSVRDKVLTYFEEALEERKIGFDKLYQAANALADQVRRVAQEDKAALLDAGLRFDLNCLIGGQFSADKEHKLYMLYPQANWVEVGRGTPYCILGESSYGKPLLDRILRYESSLEDAFKAGFLAFDSTQSSTTGVGYPMDAVIFRKGEPMVTNRFLHEDLTAVAERWNYSLRRLVEKMPTDWMEPLLGDEPASNVTPITWIES